MGDEAAMMTEGFYELIAYGLTRWFLGPPYDPAGNEVDPRIFTDGVPVSVHSSLTIPVRELGDKVDFNFCAFDMVVTPRAFNVELEKLVGSAIQRIPVTVEGEGDRFEILNICESVLCLDESRTEHVMKWTADDGRPDKIGKYRMIIGMKIDPAAAEGHHIFRVAGWYLALIVSEEVKRFFEAWNISGLEYRRVD
jgi:hypothetical protein